MSDRVDDALTVLRRPFCPRGARFGAVDVLAGELERATTDAEHARQLEADFDAAVARADALAVQVEQLREALRGIAESMPRPVLDPHNCEERLRKAARAALEAGEAAGLDAEVAQNPPTVAHRERGSAGSADSDLGRGDSEPPSASSHAIAGERERDALAVQVDEWKLEAERRGLPKELMQRLHRAEAQVEQLKAERDDLLHQRTELQNTVGRNVVDMDEVVRQRGDAWNDLARAKEDVRQLREALDDAHAAAMHFCEALRKIAATSGAGVPHQIKEARAVARAALEAGKDATP